MNIQAGFINGTAIDWEEFTEETKERTDLSNKHKLAQFRKEKVIIKSNTKTRDILNLDKNIFQNKLNPLETVEILNGDYESFTETQKNYLQNIDSYTNYSPLTWLKEIHNQSRRPIPTQPEQKDNEPEEKSSINDNHSQNNQQSPNNQQNNQQSNENPEQNRMETEDDDSKSQTIETPTNKPTNTNSAAESDDESSIQRPYTQTAEEEKKEQKTNKKIDHAEALRLLLDLKNKYLPNAKNQQIQIGNIHESITRMLNLNKSEYKLLENWNSTDPTIRSNNLKKLEENKRWIIEDHLIHCHAYYDQNKLKKSNRKKRKSPTTGELSPRKSNRNNRNNNNNYNNTNENNNNNTNNNNKNKNNKNNNKNNNNNKAPNASPGKFQNVLNKMLPPFK